MTDRTTRQGVRDLNPPGHNNHGAQCRHFYGQLVVVGTRWVSDEWSFDGYEVGVYGRRCMHCGKVDRCG